MRSPVALALHGLRRNLVAGARLALFLRVTPLHYRVSPLDFAVLFACATLVSFGASLWGAGMPGYVNLDAVPLVLAEVPIVFFAALVVAAIVGERGLVLPLAIALYASGPWFEIVAAIAGLRAAREWTAWDLWLGYALLAWMLATVLRALWVYTGWRRIRTVFSGGTLAALFLAFSFLAPSGELWVHVDAEAERATATRPSIVEERLFHRQQSVLDQTLAGLARERPGVEDLYFVGVAPYSSQDVFVRELTAVRKLFDERFGTAGRSIALANSPATLDAMPIATATNLRAVLERVGKVMNAEEDVLFLYITTHGDQDHELAFELPPLELQQLTPTALARLLNGSGIKWKVLVVSACYSGGFVEPLKDANTLVITAADDKSTSFGCESGRDYTYFGHAYFKEALAGTFSFTEAFEKAKRAVVEQELAERLAPSSPQIWIGNAIREKLVSLEQHFRMAR